MTAAIFDFPTELQPLFTADGKPSSRRAVVRTDTNKIIGEVGQSYKIVDHKSILEKAEVYIRTFGTPVTSYTSINDGAKIVAQYTFKDLTEKIAIGDTVGLQINVINTHDGSQSVKISLAGLRLTCLNGNSVRDSEFKAAYRHTGQNIIGGAIVDLVLPEPEVLLGSFKKEAKHWQQWAAQPLTSGDIGVFTKRAVDEGIITPRILTTSENALETSTAWGLYNQFTWQITHGEKQGVSPIGKYNRLSKVSEWFCNNFSK